jgi:cytochrome c oxidase subunit III
MSSASSLPEAGRIPRRQPPVPNAVLGTLVFVFTELMFFAGLISAHTIAESNDILGWPPIGQPRLPIEETAVNTMALLLSGALVVWAGQSHRRDPERGHRRTLALLGAGIALGAFFVFAQGLEWAALIREGLTLTSNTHGSFFYLIVGAHAFHAIAAIGVLAWALAALVRRRLTATALTSVQVFWLFVVGVWPILYWKVYL